MAAWRHTRRTRRRAEAAPLLYPHSINPSGHLPATFPASLAQLSRPVLEGDPKLDCDPHLISNFDIEVLRSGTNGWATYA
jgi:hypothetical protein